LGHLALRTIKQVISKFSLPVFSNKPTASCVSCQQAKAHQLPFPASTYVFNRTLELLFSDVWGPSPIVSSTGNKYYVTFVDAFSRFTWLFPIQCKSDVFSVFNKFHIMVERLFNTKIKQIQTNWGGEFRSLTTFFHRLGIVHCVSCPHTHQQQGYVERKHRHIIDTNLALLAKSHVPKTFWDEACQTSCYLINRLPTTVLQNSQSRLQVFKNFRLCMFSQSPSI
jgi:transposase InsO family protein